MIFFEGFFICLALSIIILLLAICFLVYLTTNPYPVIWRHEDEKFYINCTTECKERFPSLDDPWSVNLSVIIPAYNEEKRLSPMLGECVDYLEERRSTGLTYEIIVVSDGSTDKTVQIAKNYGILYQTVRVLDLVKNRGKGGAVRLGMQSARGSVLLFADADGATKFSDLDKLEESLKETIGFDYASCPDKAAEAQAVVCGSRAHLEAEETAKRSFFRLFLMHTFHFLVWALCVRGIRDTQCGFKLMTRESARTLFRALHVERWAFDVEMLYIAQTLNIPVTEVAVTWTEIEGSKIVPFWSWLQMGIDLGLIWLRYTLGAWKIDKPKTS